MILLAGDIGGTKTDLALYTAEGGPRAPSAHMGFPSREFRSLEEIVKEFLSTQRVVAGAACFAIAGPVVGGVAKTTNLPWLIEASKLRAELDLGSVYLLNDLEAMAHALPVLRSGDVVTISQGRDAAGGNLAVIAPGTGLGEAFLTWDGAGYVAHASEGGHADFAPTDENQIELLRYLRQRFGHVSVERVCSGIGIPNIYDFFRDRGDLTEPIEVARAIAESPDRTRTILGIALHAPETSPICAATLETFATVLGSEAGNFALKVVATGGVYLGGGIPVHVLPALRTGTFFSAFLYKGRFGELLAQVPIHLIVAQAALIGAAVYGLRCLERDAEATASEGRGGAST